MQQGSIRRQTMAFDGVAKSMTEVQYLAQTIFCRVFCHDLTLDLTGTNNELPIVF